MGFDGHFAQQQSLRPNVRFGSKADIQRRLSDVRFTLESGHWMSVSLASSVRVLSTLGASSSGNGDGSVDTLPLSKKSGRKSRRGARRLTRFARLNRTKNCSAQRHPLIVSMVRGYCFCDGSGCAFGRRM
jgi:hypothetical protein